jgi:hypothetical protein
MKLSKKAEHWYIIESWVHNSESKYCAQCSNNRDHPQLKLMSLSRRLEFNITGSTVSIVESSSNKQISKWTKQLNTFYYTSGLACHNGRKPLHTPFIVHPKHAATRCTNGGPQQITASCMLMATAPMSSWVCAATWQMTSENPAFWTNRQMWPFCYALFICWFT